MGKLTESRRRISTAIISAPSTLARSDWFWAGDYRCEQNSPHYEPHTNSSCYEEATFAEANSDKQDYTTSPRLARLVLTFHPRVLRPRNSATDYRAYKFRFFRQAQFGKRTNFEGLCFHLRRLLLPTNDPNQIWLFKKDFEILFNSDSDEFWEISQLVRTYSETERLFSFLFAFDFFST